MVIVFMFLILVFACIHLTPTSSRREQKNSQRAKKLKIFVKRTISTSHNDSVYYKCLILKRYSSFALLFSY